MRLGNVVSLHRDAVLQLPAAHLDCLIGHELGHIAIKKRSTATIFCKNDRDGRELAGLWGHHEEFAADWFGAQLCGKDSMIEMLVSDWNDARHPDGNSSSHLSTHPLNSERAENLRLSNDTHFPLPTQVTGLQLSDLRELAVGLLKVDEDFNFTKIAVIGLLSFAVYSKHRYRNRASASNGYASAL